MAAIWILAGVSAISWSLFAYPYLFYPLALRLLTKRPIRRARVELSTSLLFCAYNEIDCLPRKIANLRELKRNKPDLQILVYDDGSTDGTHELLESVSDLLTVVRGVGRTGKAAGMKQLAERAAGEILLFTDTDVELEPGAIDRLLPYFGDPDVGGVCCTVRMLNKTGSATSHTGSLYWSVDDGLQRLESATGNVMGASGAFFSVRRELYPEFPDTVQDDFAVSMSVIFQGKRLLKATDVIACTNSVSRRDEELHRKVRIGTRAYHTHAFLRSQVRQMSPRDRFKYVSRKVLRWFGGLFVAVGTISAVAAIGLLSPLLAGVFLLSIVVMSSIAVRGEFGLVGKIGQAALATFATFYGVVQAMRGRTMVTWAPAKSR